tara:strand:+ start:1696 stop:1854 length:159 start_codon:yes stop_codon:yes gene_type:complete
MKKVQEAKEDGIRDAQLVFKRCGVEPGCGQCTLEMNQYLQDTENSRNTLKVA